MMKLLAHAKINRDLHILGLRPDGYHELSTVMQGLALSDVVEAELVSTGGAKEVAPISLTITGADLPCDSSNLAWKAAAAMRLEAIKRGRYREESVPAVRLRLEKNIPYAAGLAGGSSDAAAVLLLLNELFGLFLPLELLCAIGKKLGADVPFCLYVNAGECAAAHCTGIGDFIEPVPAKPYPCLLVKPELLLSTSAMYHAWDEMKCMAMNDFEPVAEYLYPELRALKAALSDASCAQTSAVSQLNDGSAERADGAPEEGASGAPEEGASGAPEEGASRTGCTGAPVSAPLQDALQIQMSGSGPTYFALYETEDVAKRAYACLKGRYPTVLLTETLA